ncbi:DNA starvation/stationary phase protection protein Dps [Halosimplex halobium]|uniref:DNA starvation/stationary phase protection protein Dps n=1 Tax=Halosimplex halobium TaxID=3396618 RepID=UPI003F557C2E
MSQNIQHQQSGQSGNSSGQTPAGGGSAAAGPVGQVFPTRNYLPETVRTTSISALTQCLADLTTINMQLKTAHWTVKGHEFYQLHELFEELIETFDPHIDAVAERVSALGGRPPGTVHEVAQATIVRPFPRDTYDGIALVAALADRMATLDANLAEQIRMVDDGGDLDTADLLNEVSREVSKSLWFLEAHLQGAPASHGQYEQASGISTGAVTGQPSPNSQ